MIRVCPACGAENALTAIHCRSCHLKLPEIPGVMRGAPRSTRRSFLRAVFWGLVLLAIGAAGFWASGNVDWQVVRSTTAEFPTQGRIVWSGTTNAVQRWYAKWFGVEPPPPPPAPAPPTSNETKIRCWRCGGLGFAIRKEQKEIVDLENRKRTVTENSQVPCPLCDRKGGRTFVLPPGGEICPTCQGLGRAMAGMSGREIASNCKICFGRGYIVRKY
ncbi:MAG: hypothetical protein HYV35_11540 [Lentisphaerae bacterium]|nr:hypothetical protein [Lentisphaerota bacterium]